MAKKRAKARRGSGRAAGRGKGRPAARRRAAGSRVLGLNHLFLPTQGFQASWDFWTRVVGLPAEASRGEGDHRAGLLKFGGARLLVSGEPEGFSEELGWQAEHGRPQIFVSVRGLDALCKSMKARGAHVLRGPVKTHWGPRAFSVEAPDGMVVVFVE